MPKRIYFLLFISLLILPAFGANEGLEIKVVNSQKKTIDPGSSINVMLDLSNHSDSEKTVQLELASADQPVRLIGDYSAIQLGKGVSLKKIIGIKIPGNVLAGDYSISITAKEKQSQQVIGTVELPFLINPKYDITLTQLKAPQYVLSGDDIAITYQLQNTSNLAIKIKTTLINGADNQISEIELPKDSTLVITKKIKTTKKVQGYANQSIIYMATIVDKPETENSIFTSVDIFPSEVVKFDRYERFPINFSTVLVASNRAGKQLYSEMYDIQGNGTIGKKSDKTIEFHMRGPDRTGNPLFGMNDEYYLKYKSPTFSTNIGDYSFGLSELTESSRSGKGVEIKTTIKKFTLGGFYNLPRYYPLIKNTVAAAAGFTLNPQNTLTVGFISKKDTLNTNNTLYSISGKLSPFSWIATEGEYAFGQTNTGLSKAYKTSLQINLSHFTTNFIYLFSDPDFQGFIKNSNRFSVGSSVQLKKVTFSVNYDKNSTNMALDTLYGNMPESKSMNINATYRLTPQNSLNISYNDLTLKDKATHPLFDYTRNGGRFMFQNRFKSFNISFLGDAGKMINRLDTTLSKKTLAYSGTMALFYQFRNNLNANFFTSYQGGVGKNVSGSKRFYYGVGLASNLSSYFTVNLQYTSNYEWQYYTSDRSLLSLNISSQINSKNELTLSTNYNLIKNTLDQKEYNIQLRYIYKLNMPYRKKNDIGSVNGVIVNHGIANVENIRLNLNGIVTMTDKEGKFRFPAVPVGNHILIVDASNLGINTTTEKTGPVQIKVEPGKVVKYELPMTTTGRISGRIVVQEDERSNQKGYIPVKENIEKLIIEVSNETQVFRVYTDKDGGFGFEDLLPGKWQLKIYPNGLPQGYSLVTSIFNIDLQYGKHEYVEVKIQKKARQIQFQKN